MHPWHFNSILHLPIALIKFKYLYIFFYFSMNIDFTLPSLDGCVLILEVSISLQIADGSVLIRRSLFTFRHTW